MLAVNEHIRFISTNKNLYINDLNRLQHSLKRVFESMGLDIEFELYSTTGHYYQVLIRNSGHEDIYVGDINFDNTSINVFSSLKKIILNCLEYY